MGSKTQSVLSAQTIFAYKSQEGRWQNNQIQSLKSSFDIPKATLHKSTERCECCCSASAWELTRHCLSSLVELLFGSTGPQFWGSIFLPWNFLPWTFMTFPNFHLSSLFFWKFLLVSIFLPDRVVHLFCDSRSLYVTLIPSDITLHYLLN